MNSFDIIKTVRLTEKGTRQSEKYNQYTVVADRRATKIQIRKAVEDLFQVKVLACNTMNITGKARRQEVAWKVVSTGTGVLAGIAARKVIEVAWTSLTSGREDPPLNPADRRISWAEALQWAIASSVGYGIARMVSDRLTAAGWEAATGSPPPGIDT